MSSFALSAIVTVSVVVGLFIGYWLTTQFSHKVRKQPKTDRRILLPFTDEATSIRAFQAAAQLAKAENATLMPAFLARVPMHLPINAALPEQCSYAMPLLEAFEQRAAADSIPVDARIARGRSFRDALRRLLDEEDFDRIIIATPDDPRKGFRVSDLQWVIERAPAEVMILRPASRMKT